MELLGLRIADDPARWRAAGFAVDAAGRAVTGGVTLAIGPGEGCGVAGWTLRGAAAGSLDGLPTAAAPEEAAPPPAAAAAHPNGTLALDHVVVVTPDLDRTTAAFAAAGLHARRVRDAGPVRQAFYVLGTALAEVVGPAAPGAPLPAGLAAAVDGPAAFWGLTFVVADLAATAARLGPALGDVRDAVQPGRRIATLRPEAGLAVPVAFMTPRPGRGAPRPR